MNGKTAIGNHAVAGDGNCVVSMPPAGYIVIISPDGEVQQVKVSGMGDSEVIRGLSEELDRKKDEVMELQRRVIELQDRIIALKG
ncbi:MAG: bZIP transcription factor [Tannerellaceae bacterium]|nr:bZIP transcription factor [Tannerellaceae bacterium]